MRKLFTGIVMLALINTVAQPKELPKDDLLKNICHATATKINDLVHSKLEVSFDFNKSWMHGEAWIIL